MECDSLQLHGTQKRQPKGGPYETNTSDDQIKDARNCQTPIHTRQPPGAPFCANIFRLCLQFMAEHARETERRD